MLVSNPLSRGIEHTLNVSVQRPHDAYPRKHRRPAERRDQNQGFHRGLAFRSRVLRLRQLGDVGAGVLQRDKLATSRQWDRIVERPFPAAIRHRRAVAAVSNQAACVRRDQSGDASRQSNPDDRRVSIPCSSSNSSVRQDQKHRLCLLTRKSDSRPRSRT